MVNLIVNISDERWSKLLPSVEDDAKEIALRVFDYLKYKQEKPVTFNLELSNDEEITLLNTQYRNKRQPTNVLSFACINDEEFAKSVKLFDEIELGDIIISIDTMQRESNDQRIPLRSHFFHLLIHGTLHLLGYDHTHDKEAEEMENLETNILRLFNVSNPYE
jgi:probable rRNA maturation factor